MKLVGLSESGVWTRVRLEWTRVRLESSQTRPLTESMDPDPTRVHTPDSSPFETAAPVESKDRVHGLESDSSPDFGLVFESGTLKDPAAAAVYTLSCSIYQKFGFRDLRKTKIQKLGKSRLIIKLGGPTAVFFLE